MPNVILIGGPNGAGRSTIAPSLLRDTLAVSAFVNADTIAQGLTGFEPSVSAIQAGRILIDRLRQLAEARVDFAFETTLASRSFAPWLRSLKENGYTVHVLLVWIPSAELAVRRVEQRAASGGHFVPADVVRRRYRRGIANFLGIYRGVADNWTVYDNSVAKQPRIVASGRGTEFEQVFDERTWKAIQRQSE